MAFNKIISIFKKPNEAPKADSPSDIFSEGSDFFAPFKTVFDVGAHHGKVTKQLKWLSPDAVIHAFEPFKVGTTTLDAYAASKGISQIDFIKIDTQGNTFEVLEGAQQLLGRKSIKWIYAEAEFIEIYKGEKRFSEIEIFLRRYDYQSMKLYNMNHTEAGCLAWVDALFQLEPTA